MPLHLEEFKQIFKEQEDEAINAEQDRKQAKLELEQAKLELVREKQQQQHELAKAKLELARKKYDDAIAKKQQKEKQTKNQDIIFLISILFSVAGVFGMFIMLMVLVK